MRKKRLAALLAALLLALALPACSAAEEVFRALAEMSLMVAASSSTELACSMEPWLKVWAPVDTCPLAADTCPAAESI